MAKKLSATFIDVEGERTKSPTPLTNSLELKFETGEILTAKFPDIGADCQSAAGWHGLKQKLVDAHAGKDLEDSFEASQTMLERLVLNDWTKEKEGVGPQPSMVVEAVVAALEKAGQTVDEARRAGIVEKTKDAGDRKSTLANPAIKAEYESIRAERQMERADKAAKKAEGKTTDLGDF